MDIKQFVKLNENGEIEFDEKGFRSEYDSEVYKAVDKYKNGKGRDEIRRELEQEAKLTAEEKLKAEREEFEAYRQRTKIELNQAKARTKFDDKLFAQEEIDFYLSTITDDEEKSLSQIDTLINARKKLFEDTQKSAIQNLQQQQQQNITTQIVATPSSSNEPTKSVQRTANDVLSYYRKEN